LGRKPFTIRIVTAFRRRAWIAWLCVAIVGLTIATIGITLPFDGILVLLSSLFALVILGRVWTPRTAPARAPVCVPVLQGRAPPAA
jgi:hypothetical protein